METIHRKDGRLHIYVRQDKYKGELKSHNWVGRAYVNGKQKVSSSGTTNIEEAIPILEKWYDDLTQENPENIEENKQNQSKEILEPDNKAAAPQNNNSNVEDGKIAVVNSLNTTTIDVNDKEETIQSSIASTPKGITMNMLEKLKNIKFSKDSKETSDVAKSPISNKDKLKKFKDTFQNLFASKVSKLSVAGEEIAGIDISREAVRVAQVSKGKDDKWILDKFSYRLLDREKVSENILDSKDYLAEEIELAMANGAITTKNIALSIPVTSAIIRVVTSPLMTEDELKKAIETNSLWENLVQLTDNLSDYSIFHQVINRNSKNNTMEILFVASKLSDVNAFSAIVKKAGLNPVIMDVRCFSLKNAYDNSKIHLAEGKNNTAILELGVDENYLMVIHNNIPVITDIFLRPQEKQSLLEVVSDQIPAESDAVIRRYSMQIKQAIADYEGKYENKISNVQVVSSLKNIHYLIPAFKKNLLTMGFIIFDPLQEIALPSYNKEKIPADNKSVLASVLGLAYRKLDVFGYYKFVTAVKNINLLPNRDAIRQSNKLKFLSGFAAKGLAGSIAAIYLLLIIFSFFQIQSNKKTLLEFASVQTEFNKINKEFSTLSKQRRTMQQSLTLGKLINSNQTRSYRALAQITRSVPLRVSFTKMTFDGDQTVIIEGKAYSDQDILNFVSNLNKKSLIAQASLTAMKVQDSQKSNTGNNNQKGFVINCKLKNA
jgi:type IV pilus assembly protein PilN